MKFIKNVPYFPGYSDTHSSERRYLGKRPRFSVGERLHEVDLGITEYASDHQGFQGTIKERWTDFQVHEISLDGKIAKLTDTSIPEEPKELVDLEELRKKVPEHAWEQLKGITDENSSLELDVTEMSKEQRKYAHLIVKTLTSVISETKDVDGKKILVFSKPYSNRADNRVDWASKGGDYLHFVLSKVNMDTMEAIGTLSKFCYMKPNLFGYAGTKDRRAKTTQWISVKKSFPRKIVNASRAIRNVTVGNFR